ncbi:MAG TPA: redoxin domain-containing protein [Hyphomonadaceae bacterium]|nr:redoxin domain-containing protein [Hyphomonadaceae bacterium]
MNRQILPRLAAALALSAAFVAQPTVGEPAPPSQKADKSQHILSDFTLADQNGASHHLYDLRDKAAVVLIWQGVGCPIVQQMTPAIKDVSKRYGSKNIAFMMMNSNIQDSPETIRAEVEKFGLGLPVLKDQKQSVARQLGVQRTAEVVIAEPKKGWRIVYHGPLDDRLTYGRARPKAENNWATDVLDGLLAGKPVAYSARPADGCIISYDS